MPTTAQIFQTRHALSQGTEQSSDTAASHGVRLQRVAERLCAIRQDIGEAEALLQQLAAALNSTIQSVGPERGSPSSASCPAVNLGASHMDSSQRNQLQIHCFGQFKLYRDGQYVAGQTKGKGQDVLKYLLTRERQPVLRDVLLEALWPETEPRIANNRLKVAIHYMRQTLRPSQGSLHDQDIILFQDECYALNPDLDLWTDVEMFETYWRTGMRLEHAGQAASAIPLYTQAIELYRGEYLAGDVFKDWTLVRREGLRDSYLTILDKLSRYWHQTGDYERSVQGWKKIIEKDPWREDAYRQLMTCYAGLGSRGLALRWYDVCVATLSKQLAIEPEPATVALYERIRSGKEATE